MKTFEHFPEGATCPVCDQNTDGEYWLVPIDGTDTDDGICEAAPVHVACTGRMTGNMRFNRAIGVLYYFTEEG